MLRAHIATLGEVAHFTWRALDCRKQICVPIHSFIHDRWRRGKTERKRDAESMRECVRLCTISIGHVSANTHTHTHMQAHANHVREATLNRIARAASCVLS